MHDRWVLGAEQMVNEMEGLPFFFFFTRMRWSEEILSAIKL